METLLQAQYLNEHLGPVGDVWSPVEADLRLFAHDAISIGGARPGLPQLGCAVLSCCFRFGVGFAHGCFG